MIWKRRAALMAVIALVIAIPATLLLRGGDDGGDAPELGGSSLPKPGKPVADKSLGVEFRLPKGWKREKKASTIKLTSPDRKAAIAIAAPGPVGDAKPILEDAISTLKSQYAKAKVTQRIKGEKTGGLPSRGAVISARPKQGTGKIRILASLARGEKRAYLVEVFASDLAGDSVAEAQTVLRFLKLKG